MDPHPRHLQLEAWVQRIRDGHHAALALTRPFPAGEVGWVTVPIVVWRPESKLKKFGDYLRPIPVACNLQPGVFSAGFSTRRLMRAGTESWYESFAVTEPMSHRQMKVTLRRIVEDGEQARREVIEWSESYRETHTRKASASISMHKGVKEGFLFDDADLRRISDEMVDVVLDQFDRYAGIQRTDKHGRELAGRPGVPTKDSKGRWVASSPVDLEHQIKEYVRSRARRSLARLLGCSEKDLTSGTLDPAWLPVARSCEYISDIEATAVIEMPTHDSRPDPKAALVTRAKNVFEAIAVNGGAHAVALRVLAGGRMPRRLVAALRCPWSNLDDAGFGQMVRYLAALEPDVAHQDWCDALHWWVASGETAPALPDDTELVEVCFERPEQLVLLAA